MASQKHFYFVAVTVFLSFCLYNTLASRCPINPPRFVYRADFRPPAVVFKNGFKSLGRNEDLIDHVTGDSCQLGNLQNTAFVATSKDEHTARDFGFSILWTTPGAGRYIYLYKIRATEFFFDVVSSLKTAYKTTGNDDYLDMAETFETEEEWIAYQGIPRELIQSVKVYQKYREQDASGKIVRSENNDLYVSENTKGNRDAFPVNGLKKTELTLVANNMEASMSACFASCPSTNSRSACKVRQILYKAELSKQKASYWDAADKKIEEALLPWKEETVTKGSHSIERPENCVIDYGHPNDIDPVMRIRCPVNRFYKQFRVYLRGGKDGKTFFHTKHKDGRTGGHWKLTASQIRSMEGGSLGDAGYTIGEVFDDHFGEDWWTAIHIYPVYPIRS